MATTPPTRPKGLDSSIHLSYGVLAVIVCVFALAAETLKDPVPAEKFRLRNNTLIDISDFDPEELGPYPKCHPRHGEYEQIDEFQIRTWVKIDKAPSKGPFPPGHPENSEHKARTHATTLRDNLENRFTWKGMQPVLHLVSLATVCVLLGCKLAVWDFTIKKSDGDSNAVSNGEVKRQSALLHSEDAYWFPVLGSVFLFSLFVVYKYIGKEWIKLAFSCVLTLMSSSGLGQNLKELAEMFGGKRGKTCFRIPVIMCEITRVNALAYALALATGCYYMITKNWILNNLLGVSFCLLGIKRIELSAVKVGTIMLIGLFFYDVFWVFCSERLFGSNVMVTVAKGVQGPIKLLFPRRIDGCGDLEFSMLGLGDIVVPGFFLALLAKWDAVILETKIAVSPSYFNTTLVAYTLSLIVTVAIMLFFNVAQPALLYIVPFVLFAAGAVAMVRGEVAELGAYEILDDEFDEHDAQALDAQGKKES
eukprot:TRINITY_DN44868_c0_g1_i1.p1 TRINITY_DN44868_c0_g1~~TRINITY_DN44868_c0_g1_i1.p1  ORF type:complete len:500 (+),score=60.95 TRINITY_DN44868_c0_g1_i1:70-1500(+)